MAKNKLTVNEKVTNAILNNQPMPKLGDTETNDIIEILEKLYDIGELRDDKEITTKLLCNRTNYLIGNNLHYPLIKMLYDLNFQTINTYVYLYLIWKVLNGNESVDIERTSGAIFDNSSKRIKFVQDMLSNENELMRQNLVEIVESRFLKDSEIKLTEKSCKLLEGFGLKLLTKKKINKNNIIEPDKIFAKTLFFNDREIKELGILKKILQEDSFKDVQNRLKEKGLPNGVTALLHGFPGTGKTETVLQIAKETNREIIKVDISESKSMWFGESEKKIKRIFTDYKAYAKDCEVMPILLFNEADAIIGKRRETGNSNTDQTENTIQNILLEELENFDGIFLATTNLVKNFDTAFERRFLFKIEFQKPEIATKAKIWNSKLASLTETECEDLANRFDFSGGQIDNIIRKNEIHEIVHGMSVDFNNIVEFCHSELLSKNNNVRIGFTNS